jgi:alpha/beta superfamily hydrolase
MRKYISIFVMVFAIGFSVSSWVAMKAREYNESRTYNMYSASQVELIIDMFNSLDTKSKFITIKTFNMAIRYYTLNTVMIINLLDLKVDGKVKVILQKYIEHWNIYGTEDEVYRLVVEKIKESENE